MGRPTKLTAGTADFIVALIEGGVPRDHAARAGGIVPSTLYAWLARGARETEQATDPDAATKQQLLDTARDRQIEVKPWWTKTRIAAAIDANPSPYSEFSERVRAGDSRFYASALAKMREVGGDDWRMWQQTLLMRFPELRTSRTEEEPLHDPIEAGTSDDAERRLERAEKIRVKMLGTGTDG